MRLASISTITRDYYTFQFKSCEDWVIEIWANGNIELGCSVCPNKLRPTVGTNNSGQKLSYEPWANLICKIVTDHYNLTQEEEILVDNLPQLA